jgi:glycosyltransferase involved in cell wall biosynthesis
LRILILATDIFTRGGIARYTAALATALGSLAGADNVHVLPLLGDPEREFVPHGYQILPGASDKLSWYGKASHAVRAVLALGSYDLVFCTHVSQGVIAALGKLVRRTPYFVVCHGIEAWRHQSLAIQLALKKADLVLAISRFTAQKVREMNGVRQDRVRVLYNVISDDLAATLNCSDGVPTGLLQALPKGKLLLSVGGLTEAYKGVDVVLRALPRILAAVPDTHYVVVGNGRFRATAEAMTAKAGLSRNVSFAGEVSDHELAGYYRACNVFVLPSRMELADGKWMGEGFGRVYTEAALAGRPVVGSRDGGAAEAVLDGKTGIVVNPRSAEEVAGAAIRLLTDDDMAGAMGREGRAWANQHFRIANMRASLAEILRPYGLGA